jgi:hypothetical protein
VLPPFNDQGNLPAGLHWTEWAPVQQRFGGTPHRRRLLDGLLRALRSLRDAGCRVAYLDGSFVTASEHPKDFDGCWEVYGVDLQRVDPILKVFSHRRALQKAKYLGELFPSHGRADPGGQTFLAFFQTDKATGDAKGIVAIRLEGLPQ